MAGHGRAAGRLNGRTSGAALLATAALIVTAAACRRDAARQRAAAGASEDITDSTRGSRPRAVSLVAYRSPSDFPLPFRAWIPEGASVARVEAGPGDALRISMNAQDSSSSPYLNLYVFPPGTPMEQAAAQAEAAMTGRGVPVSRGRTPAPQPADGRFEWASSRILFSYRGEDGHDHTAAILTSSHDGRTFNMTLDGPLPRARWWAGMRAVLDSWRWGDGTPLTAPAAPGGTTSRDSAADGARLP